MEFKNYSLKIENKILIENLNISFNKNIISHLLGSNGVGKSSFAKSCVGIFQYRGEICMEGNATIISSYSNVPIDFRLKDILNILKKRVDGEKIEKLFNLLGLDNISQKLQIKKMSDGQRQKIKLLVFLSTDPKIIILDEFTSALDKSSTLEIYDFLNEYSSMNDIICLNITHNLSDIEYMPGEYFYLSNKTIKKVNSREELINLYMKG